MVRDSEDANLIAYDSIDQRVTKAPHHETTLAVAPNRAEARMPEQEADGVLELHQQGLRESSASLLSVELGCLPEVFLRPGVQPVVHRNSAFSLATASGPGINETAPLSISALRRSTSAAQASSTSGSISRLAINRSIRRARSAADNCRASASSASTVDDMAISGCGLRLTSRLPQRCRRGQPRLCGGDFQASNVINNAVEKFAHWETSSAVLP